MKIPKNNINVFYEVGTHWHSREGCIAMNDVDCPINYSYLASVMKYEQLFGLPFRIGQPCFCLFLKRKKFKIKYHSPTRAFTLCCRITLSPEIKNPNSIYILPFWQNILKYCRLHQVFKQPKWDGTVLTFQQSCIVIIKHSLLNRIAFETKIKLKTKREICRPNLFCWHFARKSLVKCIPVIKIYMLSLFCCIV